MMIRTITAALAAMAMTGTACAQTAPTAPVQPHGEPVVAPLLEGATAAPDCGGRTNLVGEAFCVTAPLANVGAVAQSYITYLQGLGWTAVGGDDNRVVFIKPKTGGCDWMQMQAFYDVNRPAAPETPGYIAMATIPREDCPAPTVPAPAQ